MMKPSKSIIVLAPSVVESMMHGASLFQLPLLRSNELTVVYTDGTRETAMIPAELAKQVRAYHAYQTDDKAPAVDAPNTFALVSAVQSKRVAVNA